MQTALIEISSFLEARKIEYCLIGGVAVSVHGLPRFTADIELLIESGILDLENALEDYFTADVFMGIEKPGFNDPLGGMIKLKIHAVQVELIIAKTNLQLAALKHCRKVEVLGIPLKIVSAEDLILLKLSAGGPRDLLDIVGILEASATRLDQEYLQEKIKTFVWRTNGVPLKRGQNKGQAKLPGLIFILESLLG